MDDLSNETNDKLNERVAREVMGWHLDMAERYWLWRTGRIAAELSWSPTTNAGDADQLMQHLWGSKRFKAISRHRYTNAIDGVDYNSVEFDDGRTCPPAYSGITKVAEDPHGFGCLCEVALRAYKALAEEK